MLNLPKLLCRLGSSSCLESHPLRDGTQSLPRALYTAKSNAVAELQRFLFIKFQYECHCIRNFLSYIQL
jgi:hypothetical protein